MDNDPNAPSIEQVIENEHTIESLAADLFGEPNPDIESGLESNSNRAEVVQPEVVEVAPAATVAPVAPVAQTAPAIDPVQLAQFQQWQASQQQQQQQPVAPVQQLQQPIVQQQQQQPVQPVTPMSDEEVARATNRFTMTEKEFDAIYEAPDKATAIRAFNEVLQKTVIQAVTMANYLAQDHAGKVLAKAQPYMEFAETQRNLMLHETFYSSHPDLRGADVIVSAVMSDMEKRGEKYPNEKLLFDAIAQASKAQLTKLGRTGQTAAPTNGRVKQPMAALPTGSQGGTRMAQTGGGVQNTARAVFG